MSDKVSDFLLKRLSAWGIKRIFGFPGDGILGILGVLERNKDLFEFVQVRHEEMAAFMASAHAKYTGELGVCMATSGPGATHGETTSYPQHGAYRYWVFLSAYYSQSRRSAAGCGYSQRWREGRHLSRCRRDGCGR